MSRISQHEWQILVLLSGSKVDIAEFLGVRDVVESKARPQSTLNANQPTASLKLQTP